MNPLAQEAVGSIIRWGLALAAGYLVKAGIWTGINAETYVSAAAIALVALGWSLWQKYKSRLKLLTALATEGSTTENAIKPTAFSTDAPSVTTPANAVPQIT